MENVTDEQLLAAVAEAQSAYWDATAALERSLGFEINADDYSAVTIESLKRDNRHRLPIFASEPKATVEMRWTKTGYACWCVVFEGKVYPFAGSKTTAEREATAIENGCKLFAYSSVHTFTTNPTVDPVQIEVFENEGGRHA